MRRQSAQRGRAVASVRRSIRLKIVNPDLRALVGVPAGFGEERRDMTRRALRLAVERGLAARGRHRIERAGLRLRNRQRLLIEVQRRRCVETMSGSFRSGPPARQHFSDRRSVNALVSLGKATRQERTALVTAAAQSSIGK